MATPIDNFVERTNLLNRSLRTRTVGGVGAGGEKPPATRLADEFVVFAMRANPEPLHALGYRDAEGSVVEADPDTVEATLSDCFELKRWMRRISLELSIIAASRSLNVGGQCVQTPPEAFRGGVLQSAREEPEWKSARASAAS